MSKKTALERKDVMDQFKSYTNVLNRYILSKFVHYASSRPEFKNFDNSITCTFKDLYNSTRTYSISFNIDQYNLPSFEKLNASYRSYPLTFVHEYKGVDAKFSDTTQNSFECETIEIYENEVERYEDVKIDYHDVEPSEETILCHFPKLLMQDRKFSMFCPKNIETDLPLLEDFGIYLLKEYELFIRMQACDHNT
jgi:hypothetical protein